MAVLGYKPKLKGGLGLASGAYFLHDFSIKMFLMRYFIKGQSFSAIPFLLLKVSNNGYQKNIKQWLTGGKRAEDRNTKI